MGVHTGSTDRRRALYCAQGGIRLPHHSIYGKQALQDREHHLFAGHLCLAAALAAADVSTITAAP